MVIIGILAGCKDDDDDDNIVISEIAVPAYSYEAHTEKNNYGKELESYVKDGTGELLTKYVYTYDDKDRNTRTDAYDKDGNLIEYYVYTYDDVHEYEIKKAVYYNYDDSIVTQYEATFNSVGNYTEIVDKDGEGNIIARQTSTYDSTGEHFILETFYDEEDDFVKSYEAVYDSNWIEIQEKYTAIRVKDDVTTTDVNEEEKVELTYNFYYNAKGEEYMQTFTNADGNLSEMRLYEYNENSSLTKESFFIGDEIQSKDVFRYDDDEREAEILNYNYNYVNPLQARYLYFYSSTDDYDIYKYDLYLWTSETKSAVNSKRAIAELKNEKLKKGIKINSKIK